MGSPFDGRLLDPLPFLLHPTGRDTVGFDGIESVSYRLTGLLHVGDQCLTLEWTGTRTSERVSFEKVGTDIRQLPEEWFELPYQRIAGVWVVGGWWRPRLELRALDEADFEGVPGTRGVTLALRIHRRDRFLAREVVADIEARLAAASSAPEGPGSD